MPKKTEAVKEKDANAHSFVPGQEKGVRVEVAEQDRYAGWIKAISDLSGRKYFADQTVGNLILLKKLANSAILDPTVVIELGTSYGLSTRLWLDTVSEGVPIHCIDTGFTQLENSAKVLPLDKERLTLHQQWVHDVPFEQFWTENDRVLLFVDIHSDHQYVLDRVPLLPRGSVVIFDDVWRTGKKLTTEEDREHFLKEVVTPEVDREAPIGIWPLSYADYWKRGGFWGFAEVPLLCEWAAANKVTFHWEKGAKLIWFQWPQDKE